MYHFSFIIDAHQGRVKFDYMIDFQFLACKMTSPCLTDLMNHFKLVKLAPFQAAWFCSFLQKYSRLPDYFVYYASSLVMCKPSFQTWKEMKNPNITDNSTTVLLKVPLNLLGSLAYLKDQSSTTFGQLFFFDFAKGVRCFGGFYDTYSWSTAGFLGRWERVSL